MSGQFPEHEHAWELVLVGDNPVGVTCRVCDRTVQMAEPQSEAQPEAPPKPAGYLPLTIGSWVNIDGPAGPMSVVVANVNVHMDYSGQTVIDLELKSPSSMLTYRQGSNTNNVWSG